MTSLIITSFFLLLGILMSAMPGVPALLFMFFVTIIYGYFDRFVHLSYANCAVLLVLAIISFLVDTFAGIIGAKYGGASKASLVWGWIGLVIGTFVIPIIFVGSFVGLFAGIFISEMLVSKKEKHAAVRAAIGGLVGSLAGTLGNLFIALLYFALFLFFVIE